MQRMTYQHTVAIKDIGTPRAVIAELEKLNPLLTKSQLLQVSFFNRAYLIITKTINESINSGYFTNPKLMKALEIDFAKQYFGALNHYVDHGVLPGTWHRVNAGWLHKKHPASLSLMLGANAHVNDDLIVSLRNVVSKPEEFRDDYFRVNKLLMKSARAISKSYYESDEHINYLRKVLRPLYLKPVIRIIIRWRTNVWRQLEHEQLQ